MNKRIVLVLFGLILSVPWTWSQEWKQITPPIDLRFPRDHGAHFDTKVEWWYFTGNLETAGGRQFGVQVTFFRHGLDSSPKTSNDPELAAKQLIIGHIGIADIQNQTFHFAERMRRAAAGFAHAATTDMHVWLGDWELERKQETIHFQTAIPELDANLSLSWKPKKPLVKQGQNGYSQKGQDPGNASAYVSYTRLSTQAELLWNQKTYSLSGLSWFDHEWGTSQLGPNVVGWDWWGLHLDDGRDLMIYQLRKKDGTPIPQSSGTLVHPDGTITHLSVDDFTLTPTDFWTSNKTDARYPLKWDIKIPKKNLQIRIEPKLKSAEMITEKTSGVTYWEGPVEIKGSVGGSGYMELTGYTKKLENLY